MKDSEINVRSGQVVDAAMRVHSVLGPGLLESAYEACLAYELRKRGLSVLTQIPLSVHYDGVRIDLAYRIDLLVGNAVIVELKTMAKVLPVQEAQLLSYLRLSGYDSACSSTSTSSTSRTASSVWSISCERPASSARFRAR
jgi:GxxExxY protein